jgi:hypothetical protein
MDFYFNCYVEVTKLIRKMIKKILGKTFSSYCRYPNLVSSRRASF